MNKEQRDKIMTLMADERNRYSEERSRVIARENGKVEGADYMLNRLLEILRDERGGEE